MNIRLISMCCVAAASICLAADLPCATPATNADYLSIFDGKTLKGWHVSSKTGHGSGGKWVVEDGAITGTQDKPGNGGIVITDEQFGDFEVSLEMKNDFGPDSGLFLRSTEDGKCYQAMVDYHDNGTLMGVYGEGIGGFNHRNYQFIDSPANVKLLDYARFPAPFTPQQWKSLWKDDWNQLKARITGNPPRVVTWINGVQVMDWTDTEKRLPDRGGIALQVHGGGDYTKQFVRYRNIEVRRLDTPDNTLGEQEKAAGWKLLFDGKTLDGWTTNKREPSKTPVENGAINPHKCGAYMVVHEKEWSDFVLALDFKISKGCNSGIFVRTNPLLPDGRVGYEGLEMAVDDTKGAGMHDTGAIYDLVAPCRNAMKPVGEWNHAVITCDGPKVIVELNGEQVSSMNLDEWPEKARRPDGSEHKFSEKAWKTHPRVGYIGLQDHGSPCWYKNIKILPLEKKTQGAAELPDEPDEAVKEIRSRLGSDPHNPMLHYRLTQNLMKLGQHEEGYRAAQQAMKEFIAADKDLAWMLIDHIALEKHRIDVHFNMGPGERAERKDGIVRPLSFRVWSKDGEALVSVIDFELGYSDGKPMTAAFGQANRNMHLYLEEAKPDLGYSEIRGLAAELIAKRLHDRVE